MALLKMCDVRWKKLEFSSAVYFKKKCVKKGDFSWSFIKRKKWC
jgi:hypothetical protein